MRLLFWHTFGVPYISLLISTITTNILDVLDMQEMHNLIHMFVYSHYVKTLCVYTYIYNSKFTVCMCNMTITSPGGAVIITTPASPLPIELVATTENV